MSHIAPTAHFRATAWPMGTPGHTWQAVAANGSFGREALPFVAKVLAGTVYELATDRERLAAAQEEFAATSEEYVTPLPEDAEPPFALTQESP